MRATRRSWSARPRLGHERRRPALAQPREPRRDDLRDRRPAMTRGAARRRSGARGAGRLQPRHQPDRRAALQRAADPVADPPPRQRAQGRDRAAHRPVGADRLGDHAAARGRSAWCSSATRSAAASASRRVPFQLDSGRRLRARPQDRPAQLRPRAAGFRSAPCGARCASPIPTQRPPAVLDFVRDEPAAADRRPARGSGWRGSPASASPCRSSSGTGSEEVGAPAERAGRVARVRHRAESRRAQPLAGDPLQRCHGRLRGRADPRPGLRATATSSMSSSARSSAAAWC